MVMLSGGATYNEGPSPSPQYSGGAYYDEGYYNPGYSIGSLLAPMAAPLIGGLVGGGGGSHAMALGDSRPLSGGVQYGAPSPNPPPRQEYQQQPYQPGPMQGSVSINLGDLLTPYEEQMQRSNDQMAAILAMGGRDMPEETPLNYKPYNDILQRFPHATAQQPDLMSDLQPRAPRPAPDLIAARRPAADLGPTFPSRTAEQYGAQAQTPRMAPEIAYAPPDQQNEPYQGSMTQDQQSQQPSQYPQRMSPMSPTGDPYSDAMYYAQPMNNPQYAQRYAQQQALQQAMARQALAGPPQAPQPYNAPGSQGGWQGFAQRGAMMNPNNRRAYMNAWNQANINQTKMYQAQSANWRDASGHATSLVNQGLSNDRQIAEKMFDFVGRIVEKSMKEPTPENIFNAGMKIVDAFPPGRDRDMALAAAAQNGMDLWQFRNVPQSQRREDAHQGAEDRHRKADQQYEYNKDMNPLRVEARKLQNTRLAQTNPAAVRLANARASKAELDLQLEQTYGDDTKRAELANKRRQVDNDIIKHQNEAIAKANATNSAYDKAMSNMYMAPAKDRPMLMKGIAERFGEIDPDSGVPRDVIDARKLSRALTATVGAQAQGQQPSAPQPAPAPPPMQQQQTRVTRQPAPAPRAMSTEQATQLLAQAKAELGPNASEQEIRARAKALRDR